MTCIFAGSFNPFTVGHADIVKRGLEIFDSIAICVGANINKPDDWDSAQQRAAEIAELYADDERVSVERWSGLTSDYAKKIGTRFLLRGVRSVKDYEYERDMADANREIFGLETIILFADPKLAYVTSSLLRELKAYGQDIEAYLPKTTKE